MKKNIFAVTIAALCMSMPVLADEFDQSTLFVGGGKSVSNSLTDVASRAWGVQQEIHTKYGPVAIGYLNEGHKVIDKRDGIFALKEFSYKFTPRIETSFSIGPYWTATTETETDGVHYKDAYCWSVLGGFSLNYKLNENYSVRSDWKHVMYARNNKDSDIFMVWFGYTP